MKRSGPIRRYALLKRSTKPLKRTRLRRVSAKHAKELRSYYEKRKAFLIAHPTCALCSNASCDVHHKEKRGANLNREETWLALCRAHHEYLHHHPSWARERGLLL